MLSNPKLLPSLLSLAGTVSIVLASSWSVDPIVTDTMGNRILNGDYARYQIAKIESGRGGLKLVFAMLGAFAFLGSLMTIHDAEQVEQQQLTKRSLRQQLEETRNQILLQVEQQKAQLDAEQQLLYHQQMIAPQSGREYAAQQLGLPVAQLAQMEYDSMQTEAIPVYQPALEPADKPVVQQYAQAVDDPWQPLEKVEQPKQLTDDQGLPICNILESVVHSNKPTVIGSPTGTGKTVTVSYLIRRIGQEYGENADIYVISEKNDDFCGLAKAGRVMQYDYEQPEKCFDFLFKVYEIYKQRASLPKEERDRQGFDEKPVRILLDDWTAFYLTMLNNNNEFIKKKVVPMIGVLSMNGREPNTTVLVSGQSVNLESMGVAGDAMIRSGMNILAQGFQYTDKKNRIQGNYNAIDLVLNNNSIVSKEERAILKSKLEQAKLESQQRQSPLLLSSMGGWGFTYLPDLTGWV